MATFSPAPTEKDTLLIFALLTIAKIYVAKFNSHLSLAYKDLALALS